MESIREVTSLRSHTQGVKSFVLTADNKIMISGGYDNNLRFWKMENNLGYSKRNSIIKFHTQYIRCIKLSHDETKVFSGAADNKIGKKTLLILISSHLGPDQHILRKQVKINCSSVQGPVHFHQEL